MLASRPKLDYGPTTDHAGFELYCDLVYADWLIQSGTADKIIFHGKKIAWFVSDVTKKDWDWYVPGYGQS
jgi:hypothetical protein